MENKEIIYNNLEEWFKDLVTESKTHSNWFEIDTWIRKYSDEKVIFQFYGHELILLPNGRYILSDTSGG